MLELYWYGSKGQSRNYRCESPCVNGFMAKFVRVDGTSNLGNQLT
eukprot:UN14256